MILPIVTSLSHGIDCCCTSRGPPPDAKAGSCLSQALVGAKGSRCRQARPLHAAEWEEAGETQTTVTANRDPSTAKRDSSALRLRVSGSQRGGRRSMRTSWRGSGYFMVVVHALLSDEWWWRWRCRQLHRCLMFACVLGGGAKVQIFGGGAE
jgi:hypothetical protein